MRLIFALACFVASAAPLHAHAAAPEATPIALCLQSAARAVEAANEGVDDGAAAHACIGSHAGQCMEHGPASVTTMGMVECYEQESAQWAALRAAAIEQLQAPAAAGPDPLLQRMQADYERWAQSRCAYAATFHQGGSMIRVIAAACANRLGAELTIDLISLAQIEREF